MPLRTIKCVGEHVCKNCKGTGVVGNIYPRPCSRHTETTKCDFTEPITISWPPSNCGLVAGGYNWNDIKHHRFVIVKEVEPKWVRCEDEKGWVYVSVLPENS